jgi:hypothetical protein
MTRTAKLGNGFIERKRIMSSSPKRSTKSKKDVGTLFVLGVILLGVIQYLFGG